MYKVIIADNQELYRIGAVNLLTSSHEFDMIAQFSKWIGLLTAVGTNRESLVIVSTTISSLEQAPLAPAESCCRRTLCASIKNIAFMNWPGGFSRWSKRHARSGTQTWDSTHSYHARTDTARQSTSH